MSVFYDDENNAAVLGSTDDQFFYGLDGDDLLQINFASTRETMIEGGNGNDRLLSSQGDDSLYGGNGNDRLDLMGGDDYGSGGKGNDIIAGDWENSNSQVDSPNPGIDTIEGGDGLDLLWGGGLGDFIDGGTGDDTIYGDRTPFRVESTKPGNDRLNGGEGVDTIFGQGGADTVDGGSGKDLLAGGTGADVLIGGLGDDKFIYNALADSKAGSVDTIYDFHHGQDRIDVSAIDAKTGAKNNQFTFIGSADFHNVKGELRYEDGIVSADVNGNGVADLIIRIGQAPATMFPGDFIL